MGSERRLEAAIATLGNRERKQTTREHEKSDIGPTEINSQDGRETNTHNRSPGATLLVLVNLTRTSHGRGPFSAQYSSAKEWGFYPTLIHYCFLVRPSVGAGGLDLTYNDYS